MSKYQVRIPDLNYYQAQIKCQAACPVRTDARGYVTAIARGDLAEAYRIAREPNPLASICGRVCNAPCEAACRRGSIDEPIAIRPLKRVVTERYGVESQRTLTAHPPVTRQPIALDLSNLTEPNTTERSRTALAALAQTPGRKTGRVAVIGSGPAGLSCAHDLAVLGHAVTLFEAAAAPGGMLRMGIPLYRLDRTLLDLEIESIVGLGVDLRLHSAIGREISFAELRRDFDAIFLATGLGKGRSLRIPGVELDGVLIAVDFLLNVNMGYKVDLGQRVLVIGGGNVAVDAARMALRQQQAGDSARSLEQTAAGSLAPGEDESLHAALDVARTALRLGVTDVSMVALESWAELPASKVEIEEALEEGIAIHPSRGPKQIIGADGQVTGLETLDVASVFDATGRFNPTFVPNSERIWECDTIILAIGQAADLDFLGADHGVAISPRGLVVADPATGATSVPGIYAGGDVVYGPRILIEGVRDGQRAAHAIDSQIQGKQLVMETAIQWQEQVRHQMPTGYTERPRTPVPVRPLDRRIGIAEVELGYDEAAAKAQAERCLQCGINTVFDANKCILCNGCVDVCPWNCLKIVNVSDLTGDAEFAKAVKARYGVELLDLAQSDTPAAAMIKDDERCTRCALCAQRCPTGAITMESFHFQETLRYR
ncbi:MAG: 4Fe-4S dicluster domain-containing protein [Caldilinea sp. CFX5]|nr:4Fe-4S dicluster domain-containing protein [Caldilinea sp. CFX5]